MNYLAHFHLAWPDEGLVAGGLEGDYYKGPMRGELPEPIERGVKLHRAIDAYTDGHPTIQALRAEFPAHLRRYAGILIDLSFDHYLSRHWSAFSDIALPEFNEQIYRSLRSHETQLSAGSRRMLSRLEEYDILGLYVNWETVPASAKRIGERFRRYNPFTDLERDLAAAKASLEPAFLDFYPQLQKFCIAQESALN